MTQTRVDIEGLALRRSIERGDAAWLASVEKSFTALCAVPHTYPDDPTHHYEEWVVRHRVFHRTLVNACGSQWLLGFRDVLHEQSERYRRLAIRRNTEKSRNVEAEHARHRQRHAQARCRRRSRGALEAFHDDHAPRRARYTENVRRWRHRLIDRSKTKPNQEKAKGNVTMSITRRHILATITAATLLGASGIAQAADTVRIGLPTKTYWPTTIAETAVRQKLFEKEGIAAELTIYRGGAETFEAMAAGAADVILDATSLVSAGRKKGVNSKVLANAAMGYYGWQLMTLSKSTLGVSDLKGKKVAITSAGSGSDLLALWTQQDKKIEFTRVPVGGGGLVPNLLAGNVDAAVVYSPLSFQISKSGEARTILDFSKEVPPNLAAGWIALDKYVQDKPQMVQKTLNALYGALAFMRANKDASVKLITELYEIPAEIAALEYENTIMKLETDGSMDGPKIPEQLQLALDMAKAGGMKDLGPAAEIISTQFKPVPTKP